ncbi:HAD-IB family hydrolase [Dasania sp. GY-MA-18]|uniref:Histidinol-phosphatase n=1 Tax=Dasania phycosphaerae TaxID=2950436 RepID=A0A9J6RJP3_9GAMM|nr:MULTISPECIES: HAD family hydrolase [Dasania]MCR8922190.1 HAD-IB family hydrolase [Dasania sp. GY-MA-18]MCZ0864618.1 HAD-IB family hydrolase [Dasania phycosphaerae]MCZ0868346.1 HAD-IB family hydrolase [Dasania phycosphaerae]
MTLAIFDLDNTLLNGDSDHGWGQFLVEQGIVDSHSYKQGNDYFYQQYKDGSLNIYEYLEFSLAPLKAHPKAQLDQWHQQFMAEVIAPMRQAKADALLQQHRKQGHELLIITATNLFVTGPIANSMGVEHILASEPELVNGEYTGRVTGTPCFQEGKVKRLEAWMAEHGHSLAGSYFYSDSLNDLPLLKLVDNPVAVDADETLSAYAQAQGWPCISLRG